MSCAFVASVVCVTPYSGNEYIGEYIYVYLLYIFTKEQSWVSTYERRLFRFEEMWMDVLIEGSQRGGVDADAAVAATSGMTPVVVNIFDVENVAIGGYSSGGHLRIEALTCGELVPCLGGMDQSTATDCTPVERLAPSISPAWRYPAVLLDLSVTSDLSDIGCAEVDRNAMNTDPPCVSMVASWCAFAKGGIQW